MIKRKIVLLIFAISFAFGVVATIQLNRCYISKISISSDLDGLGTLAFNEDFENYLDASDLSSSNRELVRAKIQDIRARIFYHGDNSTTSTIVLNSHVYVNRKMFTVVIEFREKNIFQNIFYCTITYDSEGDILDYLLYERN